MSISLLWNLIKHILWTRITNVQSSIVTTRKPFVNNHVSEKEIKALKSKLFLNL